MTRAIALSLILLSGVFLLSCSQPAEDGAQRAEFEHGDQHAHDEASTKDLALVLDNGKKWQLDPHTRDAFAKMSATIRDVDADEPKSVKAAAETLQTDLDDLIQGCTMTGEAHDQLHVYLMAYIPAVERMAHESTRARADDVAELLELYPAYFE